MPGEFINYEHYPGFWFYVALTVAADISENPFMSAKYATKYSTYSYDIFETLEKAMRLYEKRDKLLYGR